MGKLKDTKKELIKLTKEELILKIFNLKSRNSYILNKNTQLKLQIKNMHRHLIHINKKITYLLEHPYTDFR